MAPLSQLVAKPALEVLGQPLLAAALGHLRCRCSTLVVNLHHHPRQVLAAVGKVLGPGESCAYSWEPELLGGAGGVAAARRFFEPGPVLVANADTWTTLDLAPLLAASRPDTVTLALRPHPDPATWSSVVLGAEGRVAGFFGPGEGKDRERFLFTGFQLLGHEVVAELPPPPAEMKAVWEPLRALGRLRGVVVEGPWLEAGSPEAYRRLVVSLLGASPWVSGDSAVAADAWIERTAVGSTCSVDAGCKVADSVLTMGARVGPGSTLDRCVVAGPVTLPAKTHAMGELLVPFGRFPLISH